MINKASLDIEMRTNICFKILTITVGPVLTSRFCWRISCLNWINRIWHPRSIQSMHEWTVRFFAASWEFFPITWNNFSIFLQDESGELKLVQLSKKSTITTIMYVYTLISMCRKLQCWLRQLPCCQNEHTVSLPSADVS